MSWLPKLSSYGAAASRTPCKTSASRDFCEPPNSNVLAATDGIAGGISIKVVIWCLPAASAFPAGASRTRSFRKRLSLSKYGDEVWAERDGPPVRPAAGGE